MKQKPLIFEVSRPKKVSKQEPGLVRLDGEAYAAVTEIAQRCNISATKTASDFVRYGMQFVEIHETTMYEMRFRSEEEDDETT